MNPNIVIIIAFLTHWYLSFFMQTFFLHRMVTHNVGKMNKTWVNIFYVILYISQGSSFLRPVIYAILHLGHHAFADLLGDPHSPGENKWWKEVPKLAWDTAKIYDKLDTGLLEFEYKGQKFKFRELPTKDREKWERKKLDKIFHHPLSKVFWVLIYIGFYVLMIENYGASILWYFLMPILIPIHALMAPIHGVMVNYFGHKVGTRDHPEVQDKSRNMPWWLRILLPGEGYHNNHHKRLYEANFAFDRKFWRGFDPIFFVMKIFHYLGILRLKKPATT